MINKSNCSKKFKKICDKTVSITKKEIRIAKDWSKPSTNYLTIKDTNHENTRRLNSIKLVLQKKTHNVESLRQLDKNRDGKSMVLKEEIQTLQEKITTSQESESQESEITKNQQRQLVQLIMLKMCTKTYINDTIPHTIRGFTANEELSKTIAFEIDSGRLTKSEIQNAIWENCYRCSGYANDWEHLFADESDAAELTLKGSIL